MVGGGGVLTLCTLLPSSFRSGNTQFVFSKTVLYQKVQSILRTKKKFPLPELVQYRALCHVYTSSCNWRKVYRTQRPIIHLFWSRKFHFFYAVLCIIDTVIVLSSKVIHTCNEQKSISIHTERKNNYNKQTSTI